MTYPLVSQLYFTRKEFVRGLEGITNEEAQHRFLPMNCISWNIGHLAWQEQRYFLAHMQGKMPIPKLNELVGTGRPASTPSLEEMWTAWNTVTKEVDPFLNELNAQTILQPYIYDGKVKDYSLASRIQRVIYHYWYHNGENLAIRQLLGHTNLPEFVGNIEYEAPFRLA